MAEKQLALPPEPGRLAMLHQLTNEIAECYGHARECHECAKQALDAATQNEFLDMEQRWVMLARSYELSEQISNFQREVRRRKK